MSSDEVLDIVKAQFRKNDPEFVHYGLRIAEEKIKTIESVGKKNKFTKFIDRNQGNLWFFIMLTSFVFAVKIILETKFNFKY